MARKVGTAKKKYLIQKAMLYRVTTLQIGKGVTAKNTKLYCKMRS